MTNDQLNLTRHTTVSICVLLSLESHQELLKFNLFSRDRLEITVVHLTVLCLAKNRFECYTGQYIFPQTTVEPFHEQ